MNFFYYFESKFKIKKNIFCGGGGGEGEGALGGRGLEKVNFFAKHPNPN